MEQFRSVPLTRCATLLAVLLMASIAGAQNDVCLNNIGGLGEIPTMDGQVEGDVGWNNAVRVNVSGGLGSTTATKLQMGFSGTTMYLGLVVTAPISKDTTVVLGFSANNGVPADDWRIHINPFDTDGKAVPPEPDPNKPPPPPPLDPPPLDPPPLNLSPFKVTYWRNSGTWNGGGGGTAATAGNWQFDGIKIFKLNNNHWEMEFQIPITDNSASAAGFCLNCAQTGTYKTYLNVMNTVGGRAPAVSQDVWPAGAAFPAGFITKNTPAPALWGVGSTTVRAECTGVKLDWTNIGVQDPLNPANIVTDMRRFANIAETTVAQCAALSDTVNPGSNGLQNIFRANPFNSMTTAAKVSVSFRLANWGVPGAPNFSALGTPVPAGCNPLSGGTQCTGVNNNPTTENVIAAGALGTYNATTWSLNYKQSCFYKVAAHQCIHVDMDSTDPGTRFLNKSVERNMNFVPASTYRQVAYINGNQGPLPAGHTHHRFLIQLDLDQDGLLSKSNTGQRTPNATGAPNYQQVPHFNDPELAAWARREFGREKVTNMFQWIARAFVYTGDKIVINGNEYENVKRAGDFGYIAGHNGEIAGWTSELLGEGLKSLEKNLFAMEVMPGEEGKVETVISADETGKPGNHEWWKANWWWIILIILVLVLILYLVLRRK